MTPEEFHTSALAELKLIRELLEKQGKAQAAKPTSGSYSTPSAAQAEIPQPTELVDEPESVVIFFGKNNGVPLGKVSERSAEWYAQEQPPRTDSSGKPYPPRPQETALKNAARQLYHRRKGTLGTSAKPAESPAPSGGGHSPAVDDSSEIPF